jgi:CBS domain containing-hemolysin-like protein
MIILLFQEAIPGYLNTLANYGVLGIFAILMIAVIYFMGKQFFAWHKKNEARIQELEKRHDQYMTEDRARLIDTINSNNNVIENNTAMMKKLLNLVEKLDR